MIVRILLAISALTATTFAQAAWDVGGGLEHYRWIEYLAGTTGNPKENGPRAALFVNWTQEGERGLLLAWQAKLYGGTVNYDTFVMCNCANNGVPVSTKTDYGGVLSEGQMFYRYNLGTYKLDQVGGLGLDSWQRSIRNAGGDQAEDYFILFLRAGLRLAKSGREEGFHGELGIKYPVSSRENAHLDSSGYTSNPTIFPKGLVSGYAELGYRINASFDVLGYYDSWRFGRSEDVTANKPADPPGWYWLIHQPKSSMNAMGIKLLMSF